MKYNAVYEFSDNLNVRVTKQILENGSRKELKFMVLCAEPKISEIN